MTRLAKQLAQITGGMWDKLYKGSFGEVRVGLQYSYTQRTLFQGSGATAASATTAALPAYAGSPREAEHSVFTSFRYYPFQLTRPSQVRPPRGAGPRRSHLI